MSSPPSKILKLIDQIVVGVGRGTSLLLPLLMIVIISNVLLRYGFNLGLVELEELQWHINAIAVLGCLAFAYRDDAHVRVDVWYAKFSARGKALVEIIGGSLFLMPFVVCIGWFAWGSFAYSFSIREGSPMPSGLPARYIIKFALVFGLFLLGLQGVSKIFSGIGLLRGRMPSETAR